jgi:hypothetical protein
MIVRSAPVVLAEADAMRAMERLESQLRRAADDLAEALAAMREAATLPLIDVPLADEAWHGKPRCNKWMRNAGQFCGRFADHVDTCRSRSAMESDADRRRALRAKR